MSSPSQSAIITKARSKYGNFLTPYDYSKLVQCGTVTEIASLLRENILFKNSLQDVHEGILHRGNLELILKKAFYENLVSLYRFDKILGSGAGRQVLNFVEINAILSFFRNYGSERPQNILFTIPNYFKEQSKIDFFKLVKAVNLEDVESELVSLPFYRVISGILPAGGYSESGKKGTDINFPLLEAALYRYLYDSIFDALGNYNIGIKNELKTLFGISADVHNLKIIWRSKRFYNMDAAEIKEMLLPYGYKLSAQKTDALCKGTLTEFNETVGDTVYGRNFKESELPFDLFLNNLLSAKCKRLIRISSNASSVFASLVILMKVQHENLTTVIEAVRYSIPLEQRTKFLIETYSKYK